MLAFTSTSYPVPNFNHGPIDRRFVDVLDRSLNTAPQGDAVLWKSAMDMMKKQMYNSTSVSVPCPASFFPRKNRSKFDCNSDLLSTKDIQMYRQVRSENVLHRMIYCLNQYLSIDPTSITRLSKGVFVCQKLKPQPATSPSLPTLLCTPSSSDFSIPADPPINNFQLDDLLRKSLDTQINDIYNTSAPWLQQQDNVLDSFVPYSYTFGVRYTNVYNNGCDILIRGHLPAWCQTLFLAECQKKMPIQANDTVYGLFPFAPSVSVTFRSLADCCFIDGEPNPELTMWYERCAMELSEPEMIMDEQGQDTFGLTWADRRQHILQGILYCEIPENMAPTLTSMAAMWAACQGFIV